MGADGKIHQLAKLERDTVSFAFGINEEGQAVGLGILLEHHSAAQYGSGRTARRVVGKGRLGHRSRHAPGRCREQRGERNQRPM
jgi:hypothetical protein